MKLRRIALATAGAALVAAATVPAAASPTAPTEAAGDTFAAEATASALRLSVFGQQLAIGTTASQITSPSSASATGGGAILATQSFGASSASLDAPGEAGSDTPTCSPLVLPPAVPLLDGVTACSSAKASVGSGGSSATASSQAAVLRVGGDALLQPVVDALPIATLTDTLIGGLGPLLDQVIPVPTALVVDQVSDLLEDAITGDGVSLLTIEGGEAASNTVAVPSSVDAITLADGATIKIIDRGGDSFGSQPILTIETGESATHVARDRATGETTAEQSATPLRVTVADDIALLLQLPQSSFEVPQGQKVDLPLPAPLTSSITVSGGSTEQLAQGARAEAATVQLDLLSGVNGGVQVGLSTGSASVLGEQAAPPATTAPPTSQPVVEDTQTPPARPARTTLPRTGAEEGTLHQLALALALGALGIGGVVVLSSRRSRAAKA